MSRQLISRLMIAASLITSATLLSPRPAALAFPSQEAQSPGLPRGPWEPGARAAVGPGVQVPPPRPRWHTRLKGHGPASPTRGREGRPLAWDGSSSRLDVDRPRQVWGLEVCRPRLLAAGSQGHLQPGKGRAPGALLGMPAARSRGTSGWLASQGRGCA